MIAEAVKTMNLGDCCEVLDSKRKPITKRNRVSGPYPYYGATGVLDYVEGFLFDEPLVLLGEDGAKWDCGENSAFPIHGKCWVNNHAHVLRPKRDLILDSWLIYYLNHENLLNFVTGLTVPKLNQGRMKEIPIPIPLLPEQERLVAKLDAAFAAIDQAKSNVEQNLQNAKELFQSKLNEVFSQKGDGWVERNLKDVALEFGRGKSKHRPRNDKKLYGGDYPFVQTGDVRNANMVVRSYTQTYNEVGLAQSKLWPKGTVCITIAANIAETAILDFEGCFPDSLIGIVVDEEKADKEFVYFALQFFKAKLQALGKGSAQDNINLGTFQGLTFPFPAVEQQKEVAGDMQYLLQKVGQLETTYTQKLTELEDLKKSLLERAFKGEI